MWLSCRALTGYIWIVCFVSRKLLRVVYFQLVNLCPSSRRYPPSLRRSSFRPRPLWLSLPPRPNVNLRGHFASRPSPSSITLPPPVLVLCHSVRVLPRSVAHPFSNASPVSTNPGFSSLSLTLTPPGLENYVDPTGCARPMVYAKVREIPGNSTTRIWKCQRSL